MNQLFPQLYNIIKKKHFYFNVDVAPHLIWSVIGAVDAEHTQNNNV